VGPAARASGLFRDVRHDQPSGLFRFAHIPVATYNTGDVFARAYVRWLEIQQSLEFIQEQMNSLPGGAILAPVGQMAPRHFAVALNEGWRGEVCHAAITDETGRFSRYKVVDPSFHNAAQPGNLRFPDLQQKLRPVLLRARPLRIFHV
jgi:Ni,Fe-hydrogenase III large subunit